MCTFGALNWQSPQYNWAKLKNKYTALHRRCRVVLQGNRPLFAFRPPFLEIAQKTVMESHLKIIIIMVGKKRNMLVVNLQQVLQQR